MKLLRLVTLSAFCGFATLSIIGFTAQAQTPEMLVDFSADQDVNAVNSIVTKWGDQTTNHYDATPITANGPTLTTAVINGRNRPVLQFDGTNVLVALPHVPPTGTLFIVLSNTAPDGSDTRVIGWEGSCNGTHGIGMSANYRYQGLIAIARNSNASGDISISPGISDVEVVTMSWGIEGVTLERRLVDGQVVSAPSNTNINSVSDGGFALHIGGPGDYPACLSQPFTGNLAAIRVYNGQLNASERAAVASTLYSYWIGLRFAGTPGQPDCRGKSISALPAQVQQGVHKAAAALGFASVKELKDAIIAYCKD